MSDDMNITLKPKYSNFIKMIDDYKTINNDTSNKTQGYESFINNHKISEPQILESTVLEPQILESTVSESQVLEPPILESQVSEPPVLKSTDLEPPVLESTVSEPQVLEPQILELPVLESIISEPQVLVESNNSIFNNKETINKSDNISETRIIFDKLHSLISNPKSKSLEITNINDKITETIKEHNKTNLDFSDSEKLVAKKTQFKLDITEPKKHKKIKNNKENQNEEDQKEKLEELYEKEVYKENSSTNKNIKKKQPTDELKKICRDFEEHCIIDSTRDFNVKEDMYYINMDILKKNIVNFNTGISDNYECCVFYRNYKDPRVISNPNKNIGWMEISKTGEKYMTSKNKILSSSLRLFEKTNKFRKTINDIKVRAFKLTFLVYKTNIKIDILALTLLH